MLNCDIYIAVLETIKLCVKILKQTQTDLRMLSTKCIYLQIKYLTYMYNGDLALNNLQ